LVLNSDISLDIDQSDEDEEFDAPDLDETAEDQLSESRDRLSSKVPVVTSKIRKGVSSPPSPSFYLEQYVIGLCI